MKQIRNIFFDFGRTLVEHPADEAGKRIIRNAGVTNEEDVDYLQSEIFSEKKYFKLLDENKMQWYEYMYLLSQNVPKRLQNFAFAIANYSLDELPVISGMELLLEKLKKDGYKLYITSNLNLYHSQQLEKSKFAKYFEDMAFSSRLSARKPNKEFFIGACKQFEVKPSECVLIDDMEENISGAICCGINGIRFNGDAKFLQEQIEREYSLF